MIPLLGYAPDADPTTPGVIMDCAALIPFEAGMRGAPSAVTAGVAALAAECRGIVGTSDLSGNRRVIAGTAAGLYEVASTTWTDISRGGAYTLGSDERWSFVQFANSTIAATPSAVLQRSDSGAFADISGAPQAKYVEAAKGFVVAFNTLSYADEWYCCAQFDVTDWVLDVSTQCVSGRLVGGSGPITAARRFGDDIVAYKAGAMFVGRYEGAPAVWAWTQVSNDVGCAGGDAVVDTPIGHVFLGRDNIYVFDGTTPRPLGTGVIRQALFADIAPAYVYKTIVSWDRSNHLVRFQYVSAGSEGIVDKCVVYHIGTGKWGRDDRSIEAAVTYTAPTITYDTLGTVMTTYDAPFNVSYDSPFWIAGSGLPAFVDTAHTVYTLTGICAAASLTTGIYGDDQGFSMCRALRPRFTYAPTSCTVHGYAQMTDAGEFAGVSVSTAARADGKLDFRQTARWHSFRLSMTGDFEITALRPELVSAGDR